MPDGCHAAKDRGKPEKPIRMIRLTTLGRSNLGCTGSNLLSKHSHVSLSRSGKKTMKRLLVQDSWRRIQPWTSREPEVSDKGHKRKWCHVRVMSWHVRYVPRADIAARGTGYWY